MSSRFVSRIKGWRNDFITWLYIKYVFLPDVYEKANVQGQTIRFDLREIDEIEEAIRESEYNTLQ